MLKLNVSVVEQKGIAVDCAPVPFDSELKTDFHYLLSFCYEGCC